MSISFFRHQMAVFLTGALSLGIAFSGEAVLASEPDYSHVASLAETAATKEILQYGMLPIYSMDLVPGTYSIDVKSTSSKFKVVDALLTVTEDYMTADITLSGKGYLCLYMGTGEEAASASEEEYIPYEEINDYYVYHIPVEALDKELSVAAFSKRKEKWYDRRLLFLASSLPEEALTLSLPDYSLIEKALDAYEESETSQNAKESAGSSNTKDSSDSTLQDTSQDTSDPVFVDLEDGEYSIEVVLTGGSGKATVSSPTILEISEKKAYAHLTFSSSNYDYMIVGGLTYLNESTDGGYSRFTIPITAMDAEMPVITDTTAMGGQTEISYTLHFYSDTIGSKDQLPQEAAKKVVVVALIIIVGGGILNSIVKKKRRV